jgi:hypothetical protein
MFLQPGGGIRRHHVSSNPSRASVYFRLHRPTRATGSGGTICSLCLTLYVIVFIELCFNFISVFCIFLHSCGQSLSLCPTSSSSCVILSQVGLLEVLATNLGSLGYFLAWGPVLLHGCYSEKLMLNGRFRVCSLLSLILYPKHVYFVSLTLIAEYWSPDSTCP